MAEVLYSEVAIVCAIVLAIIFNRTKVSHIPIIAMTANAFAEDKQKAIEAGMDDHIAKPVDIDKLVASLSRFAAENA